MAECFFNGEGVKKDESKAFSWWKKAAFRGHANSQYELANCFFNGTGTEKDVLQAYTWYQRASELGHSGARAKSMDISYGGLLDKYRIKHISKENLSKNAVKPVSKECLLDNMEEAANNSFFGKIIFLLLMFLVCLICLILSLER